MPTITSSPTASRWLHTLTLLALASCTGRSNPEVASTAADPADAPAQGTVAPPPPGILPPRSLAVEDDPGPRAAPLSLTASDGTGLRLVEVRARAVIEGPLAFTELELEFENPLPRRIEGRFEIELPARSAISRFAMQIGDAWQEGEVVERQAARRAYEDFLHRKQDPALLEQAAGNSFGARVFPIEARARKRLIVAYSQELVHGEDPYRLPLRGLPEIERLDVSAALAGADKPLLTWVQSKVTPDHDFEAPLPASPGVTALRHDAWSLARVQVGGSTEAVGIGDLVVLFDTSASGAIGFDRRIRRMAGVIAALQKDLGGPIPLRILGFDQEVVELFAGTTETLDDAALGRIASRRALGASDLVKALHAVGPGGTDRRVLLVSDAVVTAGAHELVAIERAASELAAQGVARIDAIDDGAGAQEVLAAVTTAPAMAPGVVIDSRLDDAATVHKLRTQAFEALEVQVPGAAWVWPSRIEGAQPGDDVLVYAELPATATMRVGLGDTEPATAVTTEALGPLLRRAWMRASVQRMTEQRSRLLETDKDGRESLRKRIIELSVRERVLSEFTALLVLETEADYARFGIDRNALADVLAIGDHGVELTHRTGITSRLPALASAALPEAPEWLAGESLGTLGGWKGRGGGGSSDEGGGPSRPTSAPRRAAAPIEDSIADGEGNLERARDGKREEAPSDATPTSPGSAAPDPAEPAPAPEREREPMAAPVEELAQGDAASAAQEFDQQRDFIEAKPKAAKKVAPVGAKRPPPHGGWSPPPPPKTTPVTLGKPVIDGDLTGAVVEERLAARKQLLGWCAQFASPTGPLEFGNFELRMVVDEAGEVRIARLQGRESLDAGMVHCIETAADRTAFGAVPEGTRKGAAAPVVVVVPFAFGATKPAVATALDATAIAALRADLAEVEAAEAAAAEAARKRAEEELRALEAERKEAERTTGSPWTGRFFDVMTDLSAGRNQQALDTALAWQQGDPGDVLALVALGEVAEKGGDPETAARAYGSIIDLYPSRADLRRYATYRLARTGGNAQHLAVDSAREAVASRGDHPSSHRALAYALVGIGKHREAAAALVAGLHDEHVQWGRFTEVQRILREDLGLVAAAWALQEPAARPEIDAMLRTEGASLPTTPSLRFVLTWETDANDVDFHIHDGKGGHAFFSDKTLPSGGSLYADITTGYGPECFAIEGTPGAYPYNLRAHYYSRGPMGYGMGRVQAVQHDGKGTLVVKEYPFVVMKDHEWMDLGTITGPL